MTHTIIIFDPIENTSKELKVETQNIPAAIDQARLFTGYNPSDQKRTKYWQNILDRLLALQSSL